MLTFYLKTIIIWIIINFSSLIICAKNIKRNGWHKVNTITYTPLMAFIVFCCMCAIPIIRVIMFGVIYMMALITPSEFEELKKH